MRKVPITVVDVYDVSVHLKDGIPPRIDFQVKEHQLYPSGSVLTWLSVSGDIYTFNVENLLYVTQTPAKTHTEEVEVP